MARSRLDQFGFAACCHGAPKFLPKAFKLLALGLYASALYLGIPKEFSPVPLVWSAANKLDHPLLPLASG